MYSSSGRLVRDTSSVAANQLLLGRRGDRTRGGLNERKAGFLAQGAALHFLCISYARQPLSGAACRTPVLAPRMMAVALEMIWFATCVIGDQKDMHYEAWAAAI